MKNAIFIELILSRRHSGFVLYCGDRTYPKDSRAMKNLVRYIIRVSFSQERMKYFPEESKLQISILYKLQDTDWDNEIDEREFSKESINLTIKYVD